MFYDPFRSTSRVNDKNTRYVRDVVAARLGRFGPDVVDAVADLARSPHKLKDILEKWNLTSHEELPHQLEVLVYYLAQSGAEQFLVRLKAEVHVAMDKPTLMSHPTDKFDFDPEVRRISTGHFSRGVPIGSKTENQPPPIHESAHDVKQPQPLQTIEAALESHLAEVSPDAAEVHEVDYIEGSTYSGPERRTGPMNRRMHQDRRLAVDAIRSNRRFGRNRRKNSEGRRENDHARHR